MCAARYTSRTTPARIGTALTCGGTDRHQWLEKILSWSLLTSSYMHVVFTLPHELYGLIQLNPESLYGLFFQVWSKTLLTPAEEQLGAQLGLMTTLHSWGQPANHHTHIHTLSTAGGPSLDGTRWITATDCKTFVSEESLAEQLRARYLGGVERLCRRRDLTLPRSMEWINTREDLQRWLAPVRAKDWQVHCQAPPAHCEGPDAVLKYLALYVSGVTNDDGRMISDDRKRVTFMAKNYRPKTRGPVPVSGEEFVHRFLLHILPPCFRRIRDSGLLAPHQREEKLALCPRLLPQPGTSATEV